MTPSPHVAGRASGSIGRRQVGSEGGVVAVRSWELGRTTQQVTRERESGA
jgi:hypothetical protein